MNYGHDRLRGITTRVKMDVWRTIGCLTQKGMKMRSRRSGLWSLLAMFSLCAFTTACLPSLQIERREIKDPASVLIPLLVQNVDLPENWTWQRDQVMQTEAEDSGDSRQFVEKASHYLSGRSNKQGSYVTLGHILRRYAEESPAISIQDVKIKLESDEKTLEINFPQLNNEFVTECVTNGKSGSDVYVTCNVWVRYPSIVSIVTITAIGVDTSDVEMVLNHLLVEIDNRMKSMKSSDN